MRAGAGGIFIAGGWGCAGAGGAGAVATDGGQREREESPSTHQLPSSRDLLPLLGLSRLSGAEQRAQLPALAAPGDAHGRRRGCGCPRAHHGPG